MSGRAEALLASDCDAPEEIAEEIAPYQPPPPMSQGSKSIFAALMRKAKDEKAARLAAAE